MLRMLTLPCTSFAWQNEKQIVLMMLSFDTPSVQNKRTMMRMMLACLRQATSNHEATSMALACGRCLRRCIIVPCSQLGIFADKRSRKAASLARFKSALGQEAAKRTSALQRWSCTKSTSIISIIVMLSNGKWRRRRKNVSIVSSSVFGTTNDHHQHHLCLCADSLRPGKSCCGCLHCAPSNAEQMLLTMLAACV